MTILDSGTVCTGEEGTDRQSCAFPAICVLPGGRWLCGFRAAPTKAGTVGQRAMLTWSDDEGLAWSPPIAPFVPPPVDGRPGLFRGVYCTPLGGRRVLATLCWVDHTHPSLPFFNEQTEGLLDTRIFLAWSEDVGATWSSPSLVDTWPFRCPVPFTGPALLLANGDLACQFEVNKPYYDPAPWRHCSVFLLSRDGGRTWPEHSIASHDPDNRFFYWDQRPAVLDNGVILDLFWTYDNHAARYLNIHARESVDHGRTWSPLWDTGVPGQPAQPVSLGDGRIAMVYVDRTGAPSIKVRVSGDGGRTWAADTEGTLYEARLAPQTREKASMEDAWAEMERFSVGLPATARLGRGEVLVVFYAGPRADHTSVLWTRVRP